VLEWGVSNGGMNAAYYLGCLFYDRFRYDEACALWEKCVEAIPTHPKAWRNLSLYYFDKAGNGEKALLCMKKALVCKDDPRLLLEYEQLLKNMNYTPEERLAEYEKYPELLSERDDCYLDKLTLISQTGDFETAINMAKSHRFHIYEGGEGKLTKQHAWMHVLYGIEKLCEKDYSKAEEILKNGINMPKSYGEAKTFFNQEAHIFYCLGKLYEETGEKEKSLKAYEEASVYKAAVSEISLFRALALKRLGRDTEAEAVLGEMMACAESFIDNSDMRPYYGVGSPSPLPFENDAVKNNLTSGYILKAYALLGYGKRNEALDTINEAAKIFPYDFRIFAFERIAKHRI